MMAPEFRFECKFCYKPIYAGYDACGLKIRCPHCKNPVTVPIKKGAPKPSEEEKNLQKVRNLLKKILKKEKSCTTTAGNFKKEKS